MVDTTITARAQVPLTADIPGIVRAAGGDPLFSHMADGWLIVVGVSQVMLDRAVAAADPLFAPRMALIAKARAEFERRMAAGMPFRGKVLDIDEERAQPRIVAAQVAVSLGEVTSPMTWVTTDNTPLSVTAADITIIARMTWRYIRSLNEYFWTLWGAVTTAPDAATLDALDPLAGWPAPPDEPETPS
jgi:hypothetical protein